MPLSVPPPILSQEGLPGPQFVAAVKIDLSCGPVAFADGTPLTVANATAFGFMMYRQAQSGTIEAWDEKARGWVPENPGPEPQPLFPGDGLWKSILVAIGQQDQAGSEKFETLLATGFPKYFAKCFFAGRDATKVEQRGASPPSQSVTIPKFGATDRAGLAISPAPASLATSIGLYLKDPLLVKQSTIAIQQAPGGFVIELTANGASVKVTEQGGILLSPASGQKVEVVGNLSVTGAIQVAGTTLSVP